MFHKILSLLDLFAQVAVNFIFVQMGDWWLFLENIWLRMSLIVVVLMKFVLFPLVFLIPQIYAQVTVNSFFVQIGDFCHLWVIGICKMGEGLLLFHILLTGPIVGQFKLLSEGLFRFNCGLSPLLLCYAHSFSACSWAAWFNVVFFAYNLLACCK